MHIVSKFRDYYDSASVYGIDKTCIYLREEKSLEIPGVGWRENAYVMNGDKRLPLGKFPHADLRRSDAYGYEFHKIVVGFCGELFPVIKVSKKARDPYRLDLQYECFYDLASLRDYMAFEGIASTSPTWYSWTSDRFDVDSNQGMANFFNPDTWKFLEPVFHTFRVPVFDISWKKLNLNPCLKSLGFMQAKDCATAFQEIHMYLSGVLGAPLPPKEKIDDKVMAASKGHDGAYSFKKPPGKRGKKQWR